MAVQKVLQVASFLNGLMMKLKDLIIEVIIIQIKVTKIQKIPVAQKELKVVQILERKENVEFAVLKVTIEINVPMCKKFVHLKLKFILNLYLFIFVK